MMEGTEKVPREGPLPGQQVDAVRGAEGSGRLLTGSRSPGMDWLMQTHWTSVLAGETKSTRLEKESHTWTVGRMPPPSFMRLSAEATVAGSGHCQVWIPNCAFTSVASSQGAGSCVGTWVDMHSACRGVRRGWYEASATSCYNVTMGISSKEARGFGRLVSSVHWNESLTLRQRCSV